MRIISLHIYGYGRLEDVYIDNLSPSLQVFYGENEAGKSTIMAFIQSVLFGFPTKQQKELRYEPKFSSAYGGKVTLQNEKYGIVSIERVKGKATGNVRVEFEDGTSGGEEVLVSLFAGMDRSVFRGVFSFGVNDLQGVEQFRSAQLGEFIYGASMTGRATMKVLEKTLEKKQADLFKAQGKKPLMNQRISELEKIESNILQWQNKNSQYEELHSQKSKIELEHESTATNKTHKKKLLREWEKVQLLEPTLKKKKILLEQFNHLPDRKFPEDGVKKLEVIQGTLKGLEERKIEWKTKEKNMNLQLKNLPTSYLLIEKEDSISELDKNINVYTGWKEEVTRLTHEIQGIDEEIELLLETLGTPWTVEMVAEGNTSISAKEQVKEILIWQEQLLQKKSYLGNELEKKRLILEEAEARRKDLHLSLLDNEERVQLEKRLVVEKEQSVANRGVLENSLKKLQFEFAVLEQKQSPLIYLLFIWVVFSLTWGIYRQDWLLPTLFFIVGLIVFFISKKTNKKTLIKGLKEKIKRTEEELRYLQDRDDEDDWLQVENILKRDDKLKQELELQHMRVEQEEKGYLSIVEQIDQVESEIMQVEDMYLSWKNRYKFAIVDSYHSVLEIISIVDKGKQLIRHQQNLQKQVKEVNERIYQFENKVKTLCADVNFEADQPVIFLVNQLTDKLNEEKIIWQRKQSLEDQLAEISNEQELLSQKMNYYYEEKEKLFALISAKDEDEFRAIGKAVLDREIVQQELSLVESQLVVSITSKEELHKVEDLINQGHDTKLQIQDIESNIKELEVKEDKLINQLAEIEHEMKQLEEGQSYSELLQTFEIEKHHLKEQAREWAVYRAASLLLKKAKEIYENERQPLVLQKATNYFSELTNREYIKVFAPAGEETFIVERKDGVRFFPEELSQGTSEQLYLSIRFALATVYRSPSPYPIIMDDILVNFDDARKETAVKLMASISEKHQILFFTCHAHIVDLFKQFCVKDIVTLRLTTK
ncbi:ATP-binding protein [Bacillus sp. FJAT-45350]|uniref:ATP-binding protein n=1 Tax=Bacillus sp. FJAT-45350 TaxID=2011014 RepID=UPI000BB8D50B|nr:AAA family ATPase [Bacillus sp. FJAT-45350]